MPRYFFDTDDSTKQFTDISGLDLADLNAVADEVYGLLRDLVHDLMPEGHRVMSVRVRDETGATVYQGEMTVEGRRFRRAT